MRTCMLLSVTLLGLLLWASCTRADDNQSTEETSKETPEETHEELSKELENDEAEEEEKPKKEKTTEIEEEKDVMVLHINNFDRALSENKFLLVEFYAPWCGHCKRLEPIFEEAAGKVKKEEQDMGLAKVDAIEEKELAEEFEIGSFPTLKMFISGDRKQPIDFRGTRSAEGIIQWMKRRTSPGPPTLDSTASAAQFIGAHNITIVGFFKDLTSEAAKVLDELYFEKTDVEFAKASSSEVFHKYEVKGDAIVLFKNFDEGRADLPLTDESTLAKENLTTFINDNSLELITKFSQEKAQAIFTSSVKIHTLMFINSTVDSHKALVEDSRSVAKTFRGKMLFVVIDVTDALPNVLKYFGVSESDAPTVRIINMVTNKKFILSSGPFTVGSLRELCQDVVDGSAEPYFLSEPVSDDWDKGPVKVLVGKNFNSVALDPNKNVFVEFYAPWCGFCKELAPIWEKLGEKYAEHQDIVIAKMDATANEVEGLDVGSFPTLKYYPAGDKEVVEYSGDKTLEKMSQFLDNGGVLPQEEEDDEDDEDDDGSDEKPGDESKEDIKPTESPDNATAKDEL